nr:unnamed protein product [Callosobruchus chinensis]
MNNMRHNNMVLFGDSGYGISRWLMTPYINPETREEIAFNTLFTKKSYHRKVLWPTEEKVPVDEQEDDINDQEEKEYNSENEDENVRRRGLQRREEIKNLIYQLQH